MPERSLQNPAELNDDRPQELLGNLAPQKHLLRDFLVMNGDKIERLHLALLLLFEYFFK